MSQQLTSNETERVISAVQMLYNANYCQLVALIAVLYDHLITFDREVEFIWKRRLSKSKILYLACRYIGNILLFWEVFGVWGIRAMSGGAVLSTWTTQLIMQFRIQALYNKKWLSRFLFGVFIGEIIILLTIGALSVRGMRVTTEPFPSIFECSVVAFPSYAFAFWIPMVFFDTLLFLLAAAMVVKTWRSLPRRKSQWWKSLAPTLFVIVLRDNFYYFLFVFAAYFMTTIIWMLAEQDYFNIPACFAYATSTIMGCRLILNLCDAFHNPSDIDTRMGSSPWGTTANYDFDGGAKPTIKFALNPVRTTMTTCPARSVSELGVREDMEMEMELSAMSGHTAKPEPITIPLEETNTRLKNDPVYVHC